MNVEGLVEANRRRRLQGSVLEGPHVRRRDQVVVAVHDTRLAGVVQSGRGDLASIDARRVLAQTVIPRCRIDEARAAGQLRRATPRRGRAAAVLDEAPVEPSISTRRPIVPTNEFWEVAIPAAPLRATSESTTRRSTSAATSHAPATIPASPASTIDVRTSVTATGPKAE